jgi:uncharacterized protein
MFRLIPREEKFFDLLSEAASNLKMTALEFEDFVKNFSRTKDGAKRIGDFEKEGDILIHTLMDKLNRTFVTPIDREDIHSLASSIDDVLDLIHETADIMNLYKLSRPTPAIVKQTEVLKRGVEEVERAVVSLRDYKKSRRTLDYCIEINRLENEGDDLLRATLAELFSNNKDPLEVIKLKEIYEHIEQALDKCEDVAVIIEGIVVKHA